MIYEVTIKETLSKTIEVEAKSRCNALDIVKDITVDTFFFFLNKRQATPVSDTIYTLDIETTNLFKINGKYRCFDKSIASYKDVEKVACPYIWMFGIEDAVYYGREFMELDNVSA